MYVILFQQSKQRHSEHAAPGLTVSSSHVHSFTLLLLLLP
jgi:hypothetical protein